jgi:hypothetical protein
MTDAARVSEHSSETHVREPGRPRAHTDQDEARGQACGIFADVRTRRSRVNILYRQRAMGMLNRDERGRGQFPWLFDPEKTRQGSPNAWRPTILAELSRIEDEDTLRRVAGELCELQPRARDAVRMIRRYRLGRAPAGDALELANRIIHLVNDYLAGHPGMPWDDVEAAIETAREKIEEAGRTAARDLPA